MRTSWHVVQVVVIVVLLSQKFVQHKDEGEEKMERVEVSVNAFWMMVGRRERAY
jgi:hypothetical protein